MATRLTTYKPGAMKAPTLPAAMRRAAAAQARQPQRGQQKELEIPPATLRAAKLAAQLPASVVAQVFSITRRRFERHNPDINTSKMDDDKLREAVENFALRCRPCTRTQDDWIVVGAYPWPHRHPVRLSVAVILAGKRILNDKRSIGWTHMMYGDWPAVSLPRHPGSLKERNGLPTVVYLPDPPPPLFELVKKEIPANPGIKTEKPTFVRPTVEEIMTEQDDEYRRWLKTVSLPESEWEKPEQPNPQPQPEPVPAIADEPAPAAQDEAVERFLQVAQTIKLYAEVPAPTVARKATAADLLASMTLDGDDDGLIDPLALLLKPKSVDAEDSKDEEHDNEHETED